MSDVALHRTFNSDPRRLQRAFIDDVERAAWATELGITAVTADGDTISVTRDTGESEMTAVVRIAPGPEGAALTVGEGPYDDSDSALQAWTKALDALDSLVSPGER
ncbi:hypothetical protein [Calidifontibacter terrae]